MAKNDEQSGSAQPAGGAVPPAPYQRFEEVHGAYASGLQDNWLAAQGKLNESRRSYLQRLQDAQLELHKDVRDGNQKYAKAIDEAAGKDNVSELKSAAHKEYVDALNEAVSSAWKRSEEINREYRESVDAARADYAKGNDTCYRSLLRDLQGAWAGIDPASIDVQHLNLISHLLLAATYTAHNKLGPG